MRPILETIRLDARALLLDTVTPIDRIERTISARPTVADRAFPSCRRSTTTLRSRRNGRLRRGRGRHLRRRIVRRKNAPLCRHRVHGTHVDAEDRPRRVRRDRYRRAGSRRGGRRGDGRTHREGRRRRRPRAGAGVPASERQHAGHRHRCRTAAGRSRRPDQPEPHWCARGSRRHGDRRLCAADDRDRIDRQRDRRARAAAAAWPDLRHQPVHALVDHRGARWHRGDPPVGRRRPRRSHCRTRGNRTGRRGRVLGWELGWRARFDDRSARPLGRDPLPWHRAETGQADDAGARRRPCPGMPATRRRVCPARTPARADAAQDRAAAESAAPGDAAAARRSYPRRAATSSTPSASSTGRPCPRSRRPATSRACPGRMATSRSPRKPTSSKPASSWT